MSFPDTPLTIPVEIIRPNSQTQETVTACARLLIITPIRALLLWWMLHYLPGPDLNYWQCIAAIVAFGALFGVKDSYNEWTKGRKNP